MKRMLLLIVAWIGTCSLATASPPGSLDAWHHWRGPLANGTAPNADPPVCRLMDYGKFLYEAQKRERDARKTQAKVEIKEIRLRPKIDEHDINYRLKQARTFLDRGAKVRVRLRFRGREVTHPEVALELLKRCANELEDVAIVEKRPMKYGMTMLMVLSPNK